MSEDILSGKNDFSSLPPGGKTGVVMDYFEAYEQRIKDLEAIASSFKQDAEAYKLLLDQKEKGEFFEITHPINMNWRDYIKLQEELRIQIRKSWSYREVAFKIAQEFGSHYWSRIMIEEIADDFFKNGLPAIKEHSTETMRNNA